MSIGVSVPDAASVARKQKMLLFGGGIGLFALLLFMMWLADDSGAKDAAAASTTAAGKSEQVEAVSRKISDEEVWTAKADAAMQEMRRNNEAMKQQMEQVKRQNEELLKSQQEQDASVKAMQELAAKASVPPPPVPPSELDSIVPPVPAGQPPVGGNLPPVPAMPGMDGMMGGIPPAPMEEDSGIVHITVGDAEPEPAANAEGKAGGNLPPEVKPISQSQGENPSKPIEAPDEIKVSGGDSGRPLPQKRARPKSKTYIPSGSFFSAELIAALDAPTGGNAEQNPHPALLLVKDNAFLPNKFRSKVKECHVLASGYGDISSERVNLRTEKMSCVLKDGTVIDTKLDAYIAGEDGKAGLRGNLVSKQGALVANAMLAGTLGGVGQGLAQAATTVTQTGTGAVTSVSPNQALEFGMYSGSGSALNKLADYYIKAAEKTFPILEIAAGREATIILLEGLDIDAETSSLAGSAGQRAILPIVTADDISQAGKAIRREVDSW